MESKIHLVDNYEIVKFDSDEAAQAAIKELANVEDLVFDKRHGFYVRNCSIQTDPDIMMENMFRLLNSVNDRWINTGMFDAGFIPVNYAPSFCMNNKINDVIINFLNYNGIYYKELKSRSLLVPGYTGDVVDIWVPRVELQKLVNAGIFDISTLSFYLGVKFRDGSSGRTFSLGNLYSMSAR